MEVPFYALPQETCRWPGIIQSKKNLSLCVWLCLLTPWSKVLIEKLTGPSAS